MSKPTASDLFTDAEIASAAPELRKKLEAAREFHTYMLAHPMDARPMREAAAGAHVEVAVEEALKYGVEIGHRAGMFGLDGKTAREIDRNLAKARDGRTVAAAGRHKEWQVLADEYWREEPNLTREEVAALILAALLRDDLLDLVQAEKTIRNNIRKPA